MGTFVVGECSIGDLGIVDMFSWDTKDIWRCYEIKITNSDFHSNAAKTFVGDYNYYVLTEELYEQVKDEIPNEIGCWVLYGEKYLHLDKRPKRQDVTVDNDLLKYSLIKSLSRECDKHQKLLNKTGQQIHKYSDVELIGEINRRKCRNKLAKKLSSNLVKENEELKKEIKELNQEVKIWRRLNKNKEIDT
jgi:hypothetical protein